MKKIVFISTALLIGVIIPLMGQERFVTGTIQFADGSTPMYLVSVVLKGTTIGTTSGKNGQYLLKIPEHYNGYDTMLISSVGMKSVEVVIPGQEQGPLNVHMEADILALDEVTIIYDTLTRQTWTYLTNYRQDTVINLLVQILDSLQLYDRLGNLR